MEGGEQVTKQQAKNLELSAELQGALERIAALEAENQRLKANYEEAMEHALVRERENAELKRMRDACDGLASYAFQEYGGDARLYNGIHALSMKLEQAKALVAMEAEAMAILQKATGRTDYHNIAEAAEAAAEIGADRERLDWLDGWLKESQPGDQREIQCYGRIWLGYADTMVPDIDGDSIRSAIDAARKAGA